MHGSLEYMHDEDNDYECIIGPGEWACEEALWATSSFVSAPLMAQQSGAEYLAVRSTEFRMVARKFSETAAVLSRYATAFIDGFNDACRDDDEKNLLYID